MRLRRYRDGDLAGMHLLDQLCFRTGIAFSQQELALYAHHPNVLSLIVEDGDTLFGFAMAEVVRARGQRTGHVITIDVDPNARRCGLGRLLMAGIEDWLLDLQIATCSLEVAVDDPGALDFYRQLGYLEAGKIRGYYMGTLDARVLRKSLNPAQGQVRLV